MCGICGIVSGSRIDAGMVRKINGMLQHRGPDSEGIYESEGICMAMRRLAIIDLAGGGQPVYNEDRSVALVINGEIYNYIELRESLLKKGHRFSTQTDSEVIVHLYEEYGVECLHHLRG